MCPSLKHEAVRKMLKHSVSALGSVMPKIHHAREVRELATSFRTLPWGVHFDRVQFGSISGEFIYSRDCIDGRIVLYFHGGGYSIGSTSTHRALVGSLAKASKARVFLVNYRKAPEFPFPAALNDAVAAYAVLLNNYKPKQVVLAGDSAGGGLALAVQHACKQRAMPMPKATVCLSPWVDLLEKGGSIEKNAEKDPLVDIRKMRFWAEAYAGHYDLTHSLVSPLYGSFEGFGPILIQVSRDEMLYDNARHLARKAELHTDVTLQVWEGLIHWWHLLAGIVPEADEAVEKIAVFLDRVFLEG